jgi:hypothetical protein
MHVQKSNSGPTFEESHRHSHHHRIAWRRMKGSTLNRIVAAIWLATAFDAAAADSSSTSALASLPPLTTDELLQTTVLGAYKLSPALTGKCAVVFATGIFKQPEPALFATNRYKLKFDAAVVTAKPNIGNVGRHGVARFDKDGGFIALHTHRDTLPGDSAIQSATRISALEKLLGASHDLRAATRRHWRYFAINKDGSVDTLQVAAVSAADDRIESLEIVRGKTRPELKPQKEN